MQIWFRDQRLAKLCESDRSLTRKFGSDGAKRLEQRLVDLEAVSNASQLLDLPGRWHPLRADRAGQMSGDLDHPRRLIIEPADLEGVQRSDGSVDWTRVTGVVVAEISDTHD